MITLEKLKEILDEQFGEPFLPKDIVIAEIIKFDEKKELSITIGRRDIQIDEYGNVNSSGTFLG